MNEIVYVSTDDNGNQVWSGYVDEHGRPVERTPIPHPYSFDAYVEWRGLPNEGVTSCVYTDRLLQWDWDKYNKLRKKHFGDQAQMWSGDDPEKVQAFLRDYNDDPGLVLHYIMKCCNVATGYPIWIFAYHSGPKKVEETNEPKPRT